MIDQCPSSFETLDVLLLACGMGSLTNNLKRRDQPYEYVGHNLVLSMNIVVAIG